MLESDRINDEIKQLKYQMNKLEESKQAALLKEQQQEFLTTHKNMLNHLDGTKTPEEMGRKCQMTNLNDLLAMISLHLGHTIKVPPEVGVFSISQILIALDMIMHDERFQKFRGSV